MRLLTSLWKFSRIPLPTNFGKVSYGIPRSLAAFTGGRCGYGTQSDGPRAISRYPVPYRKELPYDIVELMEEVERKVHYYPDHQVITGGAVPDLRHPLEQDRPWGGFLPNVFKVMSHRPNEFRAFFAYYDVLMNKESGNLTKADKELIIVATSANNKCPYCVTAHSALHRIYSKKKTLADQVIVNPELADLSPRERAMLEFALAVAKPENITEEHFGKLEEHGFNREDAWDIAMVTAFFAMANRIAHLTDMRPNEEFYILGRVPKETSEE